MTVNSVGVSIGIETVAGGDNSGCTGDGGPAADAELNNPYAVHVECGHIYIADTHDHDVRRMHVPR